MEILDKKGRVIHSSVNSKMVYNYNKQLINAKEERIKEWDFYQFQNDEYAIQATIGHASIFDSFSFTILNLKDGKRYTSGLNKRHNKDEIVYEKDPSKDHSLSYSNKKFNIRFTLANNVRSIYVEGKSKELGSYRLQIYIPNVPSNDKMCRITPFLESKRMFYLNYKENYYNAKISFKSDNFNLEIDSINGLLDSGRGFWPRKHEWYWGSASLSLDKHKLGWNIGYGFGNPGKATENYFFFDYVAHKIEIDFNTENHPDGIIVIDSKDKSFHIELIPYFNNHTETKVLTIVNNKCDQVFYKTNGYVIIDKKKYKFNDEISFLEHAINRW